MFSTVYSKTHLEGVSIAAPEASSFERFCTDPQDKSEILNTIADKKAITDFFILFYLQIYE